MLEWWKPIKDFEGDYSISNTGKVASNKSGIILKTRLDRYGYEIVTLWFNGKAFTKKIHRLVAIAFIKNPLNLETVNHINGIKTDNRFTNLEWLSIKDNHRHGFYTGLHTIGENRNAGKPVKLNNQSVLKIKQLIKEGHGNTAIGKLFRVSCGCIYSIRIGKSWSHIKLPGE